MKGYLGIDWGTDSSKWCFQDDRRGAPIFGDIWSSVIWREANDLCIYPLSSEHKGDQRFHLSAKQSVIHNPGVPVWTGDWTPLDITLGEAMVFSLAALLFDAKAVVGSKAGFRPGELSVRFTHPNWTRPEKAAALDAFENACAIALNLLTSTLINPSKTDAIRIDRGELRTFVQTFLPQAVSGAFRTAAGECSVGDVRGQLVFESCAAGFPYLVEGEEDLLDPDWGQQEGADFIRKILVIDIGAGSTDIAYLLRARPPNSRPVLVWLPAAPSLPCAGNRLTESILDSWRVTGRPGGMSDAEAYKVETTEWTEKDYCRDWCRQISRRSSEYMEQVDNPTHLNKNPALKIALTGGSSVVPTLKPHILGKLDEFGLKHALTKNGVMRPRADNTDYLPTELSRLSGYGYAEVTVGRLAVSLGASDPYFVKLVQRHGF